MFNEYCYNVTFIIELEMALKKTEWFDLFCFIFIKLSKSMIYISSVSILKEDEYLHEIYIRKNI